MRVSNRYGGEFMRAFIVRIYDFRTRKGSSCTFMPNEGPDDLTKIQQLTQKMRF